MPCSLGELSVAAYELVLCFLQILVKLNLYIWGQMLFLPAVVLHDGRQVEVCSILGGETQQWFYQLESRETQEGNVWD